MIHFETRCMSYDPDKSVRRVDCLPVASYCECLPHPFPCSGAPSVTVSCALFQLRHWTWQRQKLVDQQQLIVLRLAVCLCLPSSQLLSLFVPPLCLSAQRVCFVFCVLLCV